MSPLNKVVVALAVILIGFGWYRHRERVRLEAVATNTSKAIELKAQIDERFPVGTPEAAVVEFLRKQHPRYITWRATRWTRYGASVGEEPSNVWYCGSYTAGVVLESEGGRLIRTRISRWSFDCL